MTGGGGGGVGLGELVGVSEGGGGDSEYVTSGGAVVGDSVGEGRGPSFDLSHAQVDSPACQMSGLPVSKTTPVITATATSRRTRNRTFAIIAIAGEMGRPRTAPG